MTDTNATGWVSSTHRPMGFPEFVAVVAGIMALNPLAMDLMLPALPDIGAAFHVINENRLQNVLSVFLVGFGIGQLIMGPLSDRLGRRRVLIAGMVLYGAASFLAIIAPSFETLLLARALQGVGSSATRVIANAIIRDCYTGRRMASIMSLATMIFIAVPVVAPSFGQFIMFITQWRGVFVILMAYGVLMFIWSAIRLPETLPVSDRKSLALVDILRNFRQTLANRQTLGYAIAAGGVQGLLYGYVFSSQQIFTEIFKLGHFFPLAFAFVAIGIGASSFLNSRLVGRLGMRVISHWALVGQLTAAVFMMIAARIGWLPLPLFMCLSIICTFGFGLIFANFTALAMEPQGHIAGTASSMFGTITTLIGTAIGYTIGQAYDETLVPLGTGAVMASAMALVVVFVVERGRLFTPHKKPI